MFIQISINVDKLISEVSTNYGFYIENVTDTNIEWTGGEANPITAFEITCIGGTVQTDTDFSGVSVSLVGNQNAQLYEDDGGIVVISDHIITLTGEVDLSASDLSYMIEKRIITNLPDNLNSMIVLYRMNSERDKLNKDLIYKGYLSGTFKSGVNVKNPIISVENFTLNRTFNYVYVYALKRYYFIQNVELTTKNMTALLLAEDVLMSHKDIILQQSAFVLRNENLFNLDIVDDLVQTDYDKNKIITSVTYTTAIFPANQTAETDRESFIITTMVTV